MAKYRAVIYTRSIIIGKTASEFYTAMKETQEALEDAAQLYGEGEVAVAEPDGECPAFGFPSAEYRP